MLNLQGSQIVLMNYKPFGLSQEDGKAATLLPSRDKRISQHSQCQGIETGSRTLEIGTAYLVGRIWGPTRRGSSEGRELSGGRTSAGY